MIKNIKKKEEKFQKVVVICASLTTQKILFNINNKLKEINYFNRCP